MTQVVSQSALVPYSVEDMYRLVNDIEKYPEFLPGCADSRIERQDETGMQASLLVSKAGVKRWFTTHNQLSTNKKIDMKLVSGPFQSLQGGWTFTALDEHACQIALDLRFEFDNQIAALAFGKVFKTLTGSMVKAFTQRAKNIQL